MSGSTPPTTFNYTGGIATYTVPYTGLYESLALGGSGGRGTGYFGIADGKGAEIGGDVVLTQGEGLSIAVGGMGGDAASNYPGGGGGGSFVVGPNNTPIMIAGGGGGSVTITYLSGPTSPAPVPEPASLALFGTGLAGLGLIRRRRRWGG